MGLKDDLLERDIIDTVHSKPHRGHLLARFDRIERSTSVKLTLQGRKLASKRWCGANNNMLEIYKPKSSVSQFIGEQKGNIDYLTSKIPESDWILVERTDHIARNDLAVWQPFTLQKSKLCSNDDDLPLLFKVMDYKTNSGNHKMVGAMIATYRELKSRLNSGNIVLQKKDRTDQRGWLEVTGLAEGSFT
jgi:hypothetical protein